MSSFDSADRKRRTLERDRRFEEDRLDDRRLEGYRLEGDRRFEEDRLEGDCRFEEDRLEGNRRVLVICLHVYIFITAN